MGRLDGKVVFISGVARGQGRSHGALLAAEGADVIGFDVCADHEDVEYPLATPADLEHTVSLVEKAGRQMHAEVADVRDPEAIKRVLDAGVAKFGRLDIVLANAGIMPVTGEQRTRRHAFTTSIDVMLTGVYDTVEAGIPFIREGGRGGSIVVTSSTAGVVGRFTDGTAGAMGYIAAKHGVIGLMRAWANRLAPDNIRVNTVHPTGVNTPMVVNDAFQRLIKENPAMVENMQNPLRSESGMIEPEDISNTILHLVSDTGRFITGTTVIVDAGFINS